MTMVRFGLLRLADSAPVMLAADRGLFAGLGLQVHLSIEPSWANIADKLSYGLLDAAVMLPPLALAAAAGLRGPPARLLVPMGLSLGGNSIVLGHAAAAAVGPGAADPPATARRLVEWQRAQPTRPRFAVVHAFSTHNLLLRHFLADAGADPDRDMETVVVPPADVVGALAQGRIAGFCAGAPWGGVAETDGAGRVLLGTSAIWPAHPEKCIAVAAPWAAAHGDALQRLLRALLRAQLLCDDPGETPGIARLLARRDGLQLPEAATRAALPGGSAAERIRFFTGGASLPHIAHAMWFLQQMRRWGWVAATLDPTALAETVYCPAMAQSALDAEGIALPD